MDQFIFASLSHTTYWYEVGILKVPAVYRHGNYHAVLHTGTCVYERKTIDFCADLNIVFVCYML